MARKSSSDRGNALNATCRCARAMPPTPPLSCIQWNSGTLQWNVGPIYDSAKNSLFNHSSCPSLQLSAQVVTFEKQSACTSQSPPAPPLHTAAPRGGPRPRTCMVLVYHTGASDGLSICLSASCLLPEVEADRNTIGPTPPRGRVSHRDPPAGSFDACDKRSDP